MPEARRNPVEHEVLDVIAQRWSPVAFDGEPVPRESLLRILEAARWAASTFNEQPWRFVLATSAQETAFQRLLGTLVEGNREWAQHAGALMILCAKKTYTRNGSPNHYSWFDGGQALAHVFLQATEEGLHGHAMAGFDRDKAITELEIPEDFEPLCAIALGRWTEPDHLAEGTGGRDAGPRIRRPLSEIVFTGRFGEAADLGRE